MGILIVVIIGVRIRITIVIVSITIIIHLKASLSAIGCLRNLKEFFANRLENGWIVLFVRVIMPNQVMVNRHLFTRDGPSHA